MGKPWLSSGRAFADPDLGIGDELIGRQRQIGRRGPAADAARRVVLRPVAGTEPAAVIALMRDRDAAEMRADADQHEPLVVPRLDALGVRLRVGQAGIVGRPRLVDLLLGAVADEDRPAAPEHLDHLAFGDRREVDVDRGAGRDGRGVRIHLGDERPDDGGRTDGGDGAGRDVEKITACMFGILARGYGGRGHAKLPSSRRPARAADRFRMSDIWKRRRTDLAAALTSRRNSGGVLLAPLPNECKPARAPTTKSRISYSRLMAFIGAARPP